MKKLVGYTLAAIMTVAMVLGGLGCRPQEKIDTTKTQLYVGTASGGYGTEWIDSLKARFESAYAEESFEEGKKGVQIMTSLVPPMTSSEVNTMDNYKCDIFFTGNTEYYAFVDSKKVGDITTAVTTPLTEFGESISIEGKLDDVQRNFYKVNGKYYGLPFAIGGYSIIYDVDLFEAEKFYFAKGGAPSEYSRPDNPLPGTWDGECTFTGTGEKSAGPDGLYNTWDDGAPATYEEFFLLCERMLDRNKQPVTWPGKFPTTLSFLMARLFGDFEGKDQTLLNFDFNRAAKSLGRISGGEFVPDTAPTQITEANGYELARQEGKYYACKFAETLIENDRYYDKSCFSPAQTHKDAQADFLYSKFDAGKKDIAMLIDGEWWINEARPVFQAMERKFGSKAAEANRRFAVLPLPKATVEKVGEPFTYYDVQPSLMFTSAQSPQNRAKALERFIQFAHTDASLLDFTKVSSLARPFASSVGEEKNALPHFAKSVVDVVQNAEIASAISTSTLYKAAALSFFDVLQIFGTQDTNGKSYSVPVTAMKDNGFTAIEYFEGMARYHSASRWQRLYGDFISK